MQAAKSYKSSFCKGPEAFNPIHVGLLVRKLVVAVLNSRMLLVAKVYKTIVATPAVRVNNALKFNTASDNAEWLLNSLAQLQCRRVRYA